MWAIIWAWQSAFDLKRHTLILCLCTSEGPASKLRKEGKSSASQHPSHYWSARIHGREPQWWENEAIGQTAFWLHTASPDYLHWALMGHGWSGKGKTSNFNLGCMLIAKRLPVAWETSSLESVPSICHDIWVSPLPPYVTVGQSKTLCSLLKCAETFFSKHYYLPSLKSAQLCQPTLSLPHNHRSRTQNVA